MNQSARGSDPVGFFSFLMIVVAATLGGWTLTSCGGTDEVTADDDDVTDDDSMDDADDDTDDSDDDSGCVEGDNDFYVVENADCEDDEGKLSRINPDVPCQEVILGSLDCPVDFVLGANGIGYLTEKTNNSVNFSEGDADVPAAQGQPGNIYQVDVNEKTATLINEGETYRRFVSPAGIDLLEGLTGAEAETLGCTELMTTVLFIADEGTSDAGTVWIWCLYLADFAMSGTPQAELSQAWGVENPRGVFVAPRADGYAIAVTAHSVGDGAGHLIIKQVSGEDDDDIIFDSTNLDPDAFTSEIQDLTATQSGNIFVADAGGGGRIQKITMGEMETSMETVAAGLDGPRDILVGETDTDLLVTLFDSNEIDAIDLEAATGGSVTTGLTLNGPTGISR